MSPQLQMFAQDCSEEDLRAICKGLFVPECDHRIDFRGAPGRDAAHTHNNDKHEKNHHCKSDRIVGINAEEQAFEQAHACESDRYADDRPDDHEVQSSTNYLHHYVSRLRTEGPAQPDLFSAQRYTSCEHTVETESHEQ